MPVESTHFGVLSLSVSSCSSALPAKRADSAVRLVAGCHGRADAGFALIHAATMVTAGVYMLGRNAVLFSHAPMVMNIVAIVGVLTALMAASIGLVQYDIKRVLPRPHRSSATCSRRWASARSRQAHSIR
jgi:hypothetical protein